MPSAQVSYFIAYGIGNPLIFAGTGGTIHLEFNGLNTGFTFTGPITSTATGLQTLAVVTGVDASGIAEAGDLEQETFASGIPDVGDASPLGLNITFNTQSSSSSAYEYVNIGGVNTLTGLNTITKTTTVSGGTLELTDSGGLKFALTNSGYAWASDGSGLNLRMVVPGSTSVTALAPTFRLSQFATCTPASGTARDFTIPQTYTVTAQDGSTQNFSLTVQKITSTATGYQKRVLASGPVSYWPLNETSGTTAHDIASGLNHITYGGTYTQNQTGLRNDGNPSVLFTAASADPNNTRAAFNNSLNPNQFTVECWVKPVNSTLQYLVRLRSTGRPNDSS